MDIRQFQRERLLDGGPHEVQIGWRDGDQMTLRINMAAATFAYRYQAVDGPSQEVTHEVKLLRTPCHYGGQRPWFSCPTCQKRAAILYLCNVPQCRRCAGLVYSVQSMNAVERSWLRTRKLEARLAGGAEHWNRRRPKGMRIATVERLLAKYVREAQLRNKALEAFMARRFGENWRG